MTASTSNTLNKSKVPSFSAVNLCVSLAPSKPVSTLMERIESDYALKQSRESTDPSRPVNISCHQILVDGAFEIVDI